MALDYQVLLLPRKDYWVWLDACRDYVQTFGANLTPDPTVAGSHMRPRQVVSFPHFEGAFPEIGDPLRWFRANFDGVRLDPIDSDDPLELKKDLRRRIEDNDRYGARQRPFHLVWPTDYTVVTQAFGANPQIYRRYGMPGHEGVDIRAMTNTNVYACADGEVYDVYTHPRNHAYGIHIRIQHRDGYKTVYAHLARAMVRRGDQVRAGQTIGLADSTGNSAGAHLHLSLKQDGATARKETIYPKDIIDPTSFLVWPASSKRGPDGGSAPRIGLNLSNSGSPGEDDLRALTAMGAGAALVSWSISGETIERLRHASSGVRIVARVTEPASPHAARFVSRIAGEVGRLFRQGVRDFEIAPFANEHGGGFGTSWASGAEFGGWFAGVVKRLSEVFPEIRIGFPTLAAGEAVDGRQAGLEEFLVQAGEGVNAASWIGASVLLGATGAAGPDVLARIAAAHPNKPVIVTGADDPSDDAPPERRAIEFADFVRRRISRRVEVILLGGLHETSNPASRSWEAARILQNPVPE